MKAFQEMEWEIRLKGHQGAAERSSYPSALALGPHFSGRGPTIAAAFQLKEPNDAGRGQAVDPSPERKSPT